MGAHPPEPTSATGHGLRAARVGAALSQADLVRRMRAVRSVAGVTTVALSHWEVGRRVPRPGQLLLWCEALRPEDPVILAILGNLAEHEDASANGYRRLLASWGASPPGDGSERARVLAFREWARVAA